MLGQDVVVVLVAVIVGSLPWVGVGIPTGRSGEVCHGEGLGNKGKGREGGRGQLEPGIGEVASIVRQTKPCESFQGGDGSVRVCVGEGTGGEKRMLLTRTNKKEQ